MAPRRVIRSTAGPCLMNGCECCHRPAWVFKVENLGEGGGNKCETAGAQTDRRNYVRMKPIIKCGCPATIARARRMVGRDDSAISVDTFFLETFFPPFDDKKMSNLILTKRQPFSKFAFSSNERSSGDKFDCYVSYANHTIRLGAHRWPSTAFLIKYFTCSSRHFVWIKLALRRVIITQEKSSEKKKMFHMSHLMTSCLDDADDGARDAPVIGRIIIKHAPSLGVASDVRIRTHSLALPLATWCH